MTNHGQPTRGTMPGKRIPTEPEPGTLEDLNVTGPAPIDQPGGERRAQPGGQERLNVTRPAPPK